MKALKVKKIMVLNSTAFGYEVQVRYIFNDVFSKLVTYNVHAKSMKRFYALSDSYSVTSSVKFVPAHYFKKDRFSRV